MIETFHCKICKAPITVERAEMNAHIKEHLKTTHPVVYGGVVDAIMELGHLHDQIKQLKRQVRERTGYHLPDTQLK